MDCRVKPGNDVRKILATLERPSHTDRDRRIASNRLNAAALFATFAVSIHCKKAKEAERRQTQGSLTVPRERMSPLARASGPARAEAQRARLSAFRRGTCCSERTPQLNSRPPHHSVQRRGQSDVIVSRYAAVSRRPNATSRRANHQGSGTRSCRRIADQRDGDRQGKIFISSLGRPDECARRDRDATVRFGSRHRHCGRSRQNQRAVRQCCAGTRGHLDHAPHSD